MPVKVVPVGEPMSAMAKAAVEDMARMKSAAMEAAAPAVKSATMVATAVTASVAAMAASHFGGQPVGSVFRRWH
jgi:hypothetical protein